MKVEAQLKNLRIAPRKVRLVTHALIGVDTGVALMQLAKESRKSAGPLATLLKSAIANATNNFGLDAENLYIREISVGDGLKLKRWLPRAFGRATPLLRRSSHVRLILEEKTAGKKRNIRKKAASLKKDEKKDGAVSEKETGKKEMIRKPVPVPKGLDNTKVKGPQAKVVKKVFQRKAT